LFPDRLNRPKSYMELSGKVLIRELAGPLV
jgi:hypothetical protein